VKRGRQAEVEGHVRMHVSEGTEGMITQRGSGKCDWIALAVRI